MACHGVATMTPSEYKAIRPFLGQSSGFQSFQYREIEFILGNKSPALLRPHAHRPALLQELQVAIATPSLYDEGEQARSHSFESFQMKSPGLPGLFV